jgi:twitching motility protein PilT
MHPAIRKRGEIMFLNNLPRITQDDMGEILSNITRKEHLAELESKKSSAFAYAIAGKGRFRVCVYQQRGTYFITFSVGSFNIPTKESLRLPGQTDALFDMRSGMILITGPKGSGTTSTCSYIIDTLRRTKSYHIVTIEDPIEHLFSHDKSIVSQMEVGLDVSDIYSGIETALRDNADVIYLSSIMDTRTIRLAFEAARSGKLVITTMDILGVEEVIRNLIEVFPSDNTNYMRTLISQSLKCVISQQLIPDINGDLIPLCEVLYGVRAVSSLIRENKIVQIKQILQNSLKINMLSKDNHLIKLVQSGDISTDTAQNFATDWQTVSISLAKKKDD